MSTELPAQIIDDMLSWPEFRMGVKRARVELADGRAFEDVMVAGGRVVGVLGQDEIPFEASEVVTATDSRTHRCRPPPEANVRMCRVAGGYARPDLPHCGRSCCPGARRRGTVMDMRVEQEVLAAAESRAAALAAGDAEQLNDLLHEAFRWTAHVGETYDRTEYVRRNTEGHTIWRSQTLVNPEVVVVSETAVLYAEVHDVVRSDGEASKTFRMPVTQVWVRSGSSWKCLAGHAGPRLS